jgi:hypothetical protein
MYLRLSSFLFVANLLGVSMGGVERDAARFQDEIILSGPLASLPEHMDLLRKPA